MCTLFISKKFQGFFRNKVIDSTLKIFINREIK